ncbi:MAG TPA: Mur ligase family protein [Candidatus Acidoferrales bacterium]|nr:Mur ligase family protein [Candidatus Acidoferrales bacterium]
MTFHVHILGICGYATSGAALLARERGDTVTGSDDFAYPPVTDIITAAGIEWADHSDPANLERWGIPDLVVVGNQTRPGNPEFVAAQERGLTVMSEIEFYTSLAGDRTRLTVCGTHGKTTTSALLAHMLATAGLDPGFRLGSTSLDLGGSARLGSGPFVFEGDEYTTAPWDPLPKFLHTRPSGACVTRLELDHPDVYPTLDAYRAPFVELARTMPASGLLALCADDPECAALREKASCPTVLYGVDAGSDWRVEDVTNDGVLQHFTVVRDVAPPLHVALTFPGMHNALNACAALILATFAGAPLDSAVAACADFRGPARRFEILGDAGGITVVDDYAHHPTEVAAGIAAARQRFGSRRLIAIHTPHTYSRTRTLLEDYRRSFVDADVAVLGPVEEARERGQPVSVTSHDVAERARPAGDVHVVDSSEDAIRLLCDLARPGDVMLVLSLGGFDKLAPRLRDALGTLRVGG